MMKGLTSEAEWDNIAVHRTWSAYNMRSSKSEGSFRSHSPSASSAFWLHNKQSIEHISYGMIARKEVSNTLQISGHTSIIVGLYNFPNNLL